MMKHTHRWLSHLLAVMLLIPMAWTSTSQTEGAELRATLRGEPIIRQTSYQEPPSSGNSVLSDGELGVSDLGAVDLDGMPGCGSAASPCGAQIYTPFPRVRGWTYWGKAEFLLWWRRGKQLPPLATTSAADTPIDQAGVLGQSSTQILYGGESANEAANVGGRVMFGAWFDSQQLTGAGVRFYALGNNTDQFNTTSDTYPILARPFYNAALGQRDADVVAFPAQTTGSIGITNLAKVVGGDAFWRRLFYEDSCHRIDLLVGYQAARIDQDLRIDTSRTVIATGGTIPTGTVVNSYDLFDTENVYSAASIGMLGEYDRGPVTWRLLAKVGLGNMRQRVHIAGQTTITVPGQASTTTDQGLLTQSSNIGDYSRNQFSASPELALSLAYHMTECMDLTVGYSFIYWSHVMQPGDQIDLQIDPRNQTTPTFSATDSDYFLQGLNFGLQCAY